MDGHFPLGILFHHDALSMVLRPGVHAVALRRAAIHLDVYKRQVIKRNRFIFLNKELSERTLRIVCAHEIGHDQLHRDLAKAGALQEFMLYDMSTRPEYEANIVAAEILLDSEETLDYVYQYGYTTEQTANAMDTDINLMALKIAHLSQCGYNLRTPEHRSDFLKS